jgi:hypothetical protein
LTRATGLRMLGRSSIRMGAMSKAVVFTILMLCAACTEADRERMFSTERAPLIGRCDAQPGYPPPEQRPGCEAQQITSRGR